MKKLSFALLLSLLASGCPPHNGGASTTPPPGSSQDCSLLVPVEGPAPEVQQWVGQIPEASPGMGWALVSNDDPDVKWMLVLVEPKKRNILAAYKLKSIEDRLDAMNKIAEQQIRVPNIMLAILTGVRPFPQPGPPGGPDVFSLALSTLNADLRVRNQLMDQAQQQPGKITSPTHQ